MVEGKGFPQMQKIIIREEFGELAFTMQFQSKDTPFTTWYPLLPPLLPLLPLFHLLPDSPPLPFPHPRSQCSLMHVRRGFFFLAFKVHAQPVAGKIQTQGRV